MLITGKFKVERIKAAEKGFYITLLDEEGGMPMSVSTKQEQFQATEGEVLELDFNAKHGRGEWGSYFLTQKITVGKRFKLVEVK